MKKIICMLMAFAMMLSASAFAENGHTYFPESEAYAGIWYVDDYILEIEHSYDDYNLYDCTVTRYLDDYSAVRWSYGACAYDGVGKTLNSLETGVRSNIAFDEDYEVISNETVYEDAAASFAISEDGTLTWTDFKQTPGENELVFERLIPEYGEIIPTDELVEHYLLPVAGIESQTAGASLKLATTADEVWRFISGYDLSDDVDDSLELDVLVAMDSLDEEKATAFAENFESVAGLLDACFEDFEANRGLLEDAGVAESLETICTDAVARQSWEKLRDGTRSVFEFLSEN